MFTPWDLVRPRVWHPMASLEQSMMDFDRMSERMMASHAQLHLHDHDMHEDEFFSDLPVRRGSTSTSGQAQQQQQQQQQQQSTSPEQQDADPRNAFSSYTFSNSTIVDEKGQRVSSTRRRYEDSSGRLKAIHERQIGDKKLRTAWNRQHKDDEGKHEQTLLGAADEADTSLDAFEAAWQQTAFGQAEAQNKKHQEVIKETGESA